jgi:hypothetical protein
MAVSGYRDRPLLSPRQLTRGDACRWRPVTFPQSTKRRFGRYPTHNEFLRQMQLNSRTNR